MSSTPPSYDEAAAHVAAYAAQLSRFRPAVERVELGRAPGRVLARPLYADRDQPPFARSTRDGFACRAVEASAHVSLAIAGTTRAGETPAGELPSGSAWEIMTGAPVPPGADAVAMLEHVETANGQMKLEQRRTIAVGENIVAMGAQARKGDELLPAGAAIASAQVALAAACGHAALEVFARPRVAILTTGDEIVPVKSIPAPGQIRNSNGPMLAAMVVAAGGEPWLLPTASDNARALDTALSQAMEADLLLVTGGVSAGKFDLVEPALARAGARFHFTGVRIQPGKPLVFGEMLKHRNVAGNATGIAASNAAGRVPIVVHSLPFFGLPGNPVSSAVTFLLFAAPVLAALSGSPDPGPRFALARLAQGTEKHGKVGLTRFLPAKCTFGADGKLPEVAFVPWQGSGDLAAMACSNCFLVLPEESSHPEPGTIVRILLY
ncbi:MAG TPA: molybdopterin molybdotransferase MoeA [Terracidiphilus sp.]|nr:molybdopterin molybdotransferase MoeA [Terracidiphilus sp.]